MYQVFKKVDVWGEEVIDLIYKGESLIYTTSSIIQNIFSTSEMEGGGFWEEFYQAIYECHGDVKPENLTWEQFLEVFYDDDFGFYKRYVIQEVKDIAISFDEADKENLIREQEFIKDRKRLSEERELKQKEIEFERLKKELGK